MREMDLSDVMRPNNRLKRMKYITTRSSHKVRSEEEMVMLAKVARNRFKKAVESGRIEMISKREWTLH